MRDEDLEENDRKEREQREAYHPAESGYCGECENCHRQRVELCNNGKRICEKCHWDQEAHAYDGKHLDFFG